MQGVHRLNLYAEEAQVAGCADVAQWDETEQIGDEKALSLIIRMVVRPHVEEVWMVILVPCKEQAELQKYHEDRQEHEHDTHGNS